MTLEQIKIDLEDRNIRIVAERIGVEYMTLLRIAQGKTKKPKKVVLDKITGYLYE